MDRNKAIAYSYSFLSYIFGSRIPVQIKEIILFGSASRNELSDESDIDIFINVKQGTKEVKKFVDSALEGFYESKAAELWSLKGLSPKLRVMVGDLDTWKLKRSIISEGITLFGPYKEIPKQSMQWILVTFRPLKDVTKRNRLIRQLFGRKESGHEKLGSVSKAGGRLLTPTVFLVPAESFHAVHDILRKEKIDYTTFEIWTDAIKGKKL